MAPRLPPPDPHESPLEPVMRGPLSAPTVIFPPGEPTTDADRVADRVLELRPGLLVVVAR